MSVAVPSSRTMLETTVERSPADVLRLVVAAVVLAVAALLSHFFGGTSSEFVADLLSGLERLPAGLVTAVVVLGELLGLGLIVIGGVLAVVHRRWRLIAGIVVGVAVSVPLFWLVRPDSSDSAAVVTRTQQWLGDLTFEGPSSFALAGVVAITAAVTPWTSRRWRRAWWAAAIAVAMAHLIGTPVSFETVLAVLVGWVAGSASVVILGAPSRRPTEAAVVDGLRSIGVDLERLEPASVDARGSTPYFGALRGGTPVFVKTLGDDERSADLLFRLYRSIQPRDLHDERPFSSLRRTVEHEALVAVMAGQVGVRTPPLVAFAPAEPNGYTLAYEAVAGHSLDREPDGDDLDQLVRQVWGQVAILRRTRIAHRDLRLANVFVGEDRVVWLIDFGFSELAADDVLLDGDVAELLASTASVMGPDRALAAAVAVMGVDAVRRCVHRLRPSLLSGATRTSLGEQSGVLDQLAGLAEEA
jgi:tRNA A-37 threonylcarbamoyl transferase component Bud32